jgi:hypothetical protein
MTKIMQSGPAMGGRRPEPDLSRQTVEDAPDILMKEPPAPFGYKEIVGTRGADLCISAARISSENLACRWVKRHEARLAELGTANGQHPLFEVNVRPP